MPDKEIKITGLEPVIEQSIQKLSLDKQVEKRGIANDIFQEPFPKYNAAPCEIVIEGKNNSWIVLGRDRPASKLSGYGGKGHTGAGSIDLIVGRMSQNPIQVDNEGNTIYADPSFKEDAARIQISQKSDVDKNFEIVAGKVGKVNAKSSVAIKADSIRIIGREGIKLVTRTDVKNSAGQPIYAVNGIDLIAGNDDTDMQPIPKGDSLAESLERLVFHVDKLVSIVDVILMAQMKMNEAVTNHTHISPFYGLMTSPSFPVQTAGLKTMMDFTTKAKTSILSIKQNLINFKLNYFSPAGSKYINSRYNNTN
ncbi:hypothetical protein M0R19_04405 [Candidatus Pacearchaeota archaeon]|jgi:hypothetical protein|nr:hypothetical protein [Candidatus Pacearchaeota archaeon]